MKYGLAYLNDLKQPFFSNKNGAAVSFHRNIQGHLLPLLVLARVVLCAGLTPSRNGVQSGGAHRIAGQRALL